MKTRKELQQEYKLQKTPKGVYQIKNKENNKILIGSSLNLVAIWNRTKTQLNFGNHPNKELQQDWKEFGESAFEYSIIEEIEEKENQNIDFNKEIKVLEELYLNELTPFDEKGYNKRG